MSKINTVRFCLPEFARNRFKKKKKLSRKKSNFNRKRPRYKFVNSIKKIMLEKKNISPFFPVKNNSPNSGRIKKKRITVKKIILLLYSAAKKKKKAIPF